MARFAFALALCCVMASLAHLNLAHAQDPQIAQGQRVFMLCSPCHSPDTQTNRVGPHLGDVFNRPMASVPDFAYSQAMRDYAATGALWDAATLDAYLAKPQAAVPGTRMMFGGVSDPARRAALIAYLQSLKQP